MNTCRANRVSPEPPREQGFTLIELLTTLVVAAVLLTLGVPSYRQLAMDNRTSTEANDFVLALTIARSEAGKRGVAVSVTAANAADAANEFGPGWNVFVDADADGVFDNGETLLRTASGRAANGTLDSNQGSTFVQYRPWGNLSVSPAQRTFDLCDSRAGENGRRITIGTTGRPSVTTITCI